MRGAIQFGGPVTATWESVSPPANWGAGVRLGGQVQRPAAARRPAGYQGAGPLPREKGLPRYGTGWLPVFFSAWCSAEPALADRLPHRGPQSPPCHDTDLAGLAHCCGLRMICAGPWTTLPVCGLSSWCFGFPSLLEAGGTLARCFRLRRGPPPPLLFARARLPPWGCSPPPRPRGAETLLALCGLVKGAGGKKIVCLMTYCLCCMWIGSGLFSCSCS